MRDQCRSAGVPFFMKQMGSRPYEWHPSPAVEAVSSSKVAGIADRYVRQPDIERVRLRHNHGGAMEEWPADLRVREFPAVAV